ncbi:hypothetical protein NADE_003044 [Nannochloris sp. 'desiccata']|nr:hypothetical protein KSW81_000899 [Chlorella desiccata (nom. nud.)]KAH7620421.1 hypothetical protein NADE_003044 [Chlorella desiccata (nom. nud.)]
MPSNLVFEVAEAGLPNQAMVLHNCAKYITSNQQARARGVNEASYQLTPAIPQPYPSSSTRHGAAQLNKQLKSMDAPTHHLQSWHDADEEATAFTSDQSSLLTGLQLHIPRLAASVGSMMQPQGDTHNDDTTGQRLINIATSLPFFAIGANMLRRYRTPEGREYGYSILAVGAAATLYHASSGKLRRIARKLDYWTIAASSTCMMKALFPEKPWIRRSLSASLLAVPFKPFAISTAHTVAMQAEFARQAVEHEYMRPYFKYHAVAALTGVAAFAVEDILLERGMGHVHALWHLLSAAAVASTGALVEHKETLRIGRVDTITGDGLSTPVINGLRPCHDSVASFTGMSGNGGGSWSGSSGKDGTPRSSTSL